MRVYQQADSDPEPPRSAFAPMGRELAAARSSHDAAQTLRAELTREPDVADTHPSLAERINRAVLSMDAGDSPASYAVGRILLDRGDDSGLAHLERAMDADPEAVVPACEAAIVFLESQGRQAEAETYRRRAESQVEVYEQAVVERQEVDVDDELEPANLDEDVLAQIREVVSRHPEVRTAFVVRKRLRHLADEYPLYVLALIPAKRWRQLWKEADAEEKDESTLADRVAGDLDLPVDLQVIIPGPRAGMDERLERIPGAKVFTRG